MEYISVDEAIAANDRIFGIMFCAFVAFAALVLVAAIIYEKRRDRKAAQAFDEAVEEAENHIRAKYEKKRRSTLTFRLWQDEKLLREKTERDLLTVTEERDEARKELANLKQDAAACPAFGTVSRRGAI